jgi:hypothetical protein
VNTVLPGRTALYRDDQRAPLVHLDLFRAQQGKLTAFIVLLELTAAAVKAHARHAPPDRISPTAGSPAAVFVLLVHTAAALVKLHARLALPGRSKHRLDKRHAPCVLLAHTAAAGQRHVHAQLAHT